MALPAGIAAGAEDQQVSLLQVRQAADHFPAVDGLRRDGASEFVAEFSEDELREPGTVKHLGTVPATPVGRAEIQLRFVYDAVGQLGDGHLDTVSG